MGKKRRNEDGSKKKNRNRSKRKKTLTDEGNEGVFEGDSISRLRMPNASASNNLDHCDYCDVDVPKNIKCIKDHYSGSKHVNRVKIQKSLSEFVSHGMDWMTGSKQFFCKECGVVLEAKFETLTRHVTKHASKHESGSGVDDCTKSERDTDVLKLVA